LAARDVRELSSAGRYDAWNPGLESRLPRELLPLSTMFRPENAWTTLREVHELAELTGLPVHDVVAFRPLRLALHEVLIRVMADLHVPIGARVEDLGINFRQMTGTILERYVAPRIGEIESEYDAVRRRLAAEIRGELDARLFGSDAAKPAVQRGRFAWLRRAASADAPDADDASDATRAVAAWHAVAHADGDGVRRAACRALAKVVASLVGLHGRVWGTPELIASVATSLACNDAGSEAIGRIVEPLFQEAVHREGYRLLPAHARPVIMNTKGASAAGKSTMRSEQRALSERIGADWDDFAVISPDIWRKQLLDYASLGDAYKYAGACTGEELAIIDRKLDRYMARKAERLAMSHLLIDRFRFDSFAPDSDEAGSNLLTRFGHTIYLFFMITPPEAIVERGWQRGLEVGRYKAVDDLLAHNIEAYAGMPELFFTWALRADKDVHYEFLDNSVPFGERPRTVAFGWNGEMNALDVGALLDVQRFRRVNVNAKGPRDLYPDRGALAPERNTAFLVACAKRLPRLNFAEQGSGRIYLRLEANAPVWVDREALNVALRDPDTRAGIEAVVPGIAHRALPGGEAPAFLVDRVRAERIHTLGQWGSRPSPREPGQGA
jgi:hypothetical protein